MGIAEIEQKLRAAKERLNKSLPVAPSGMVTILPDFQAARNQVLIVERELAEAKGEEYAVPFDFPVQWDAGAPLPLLIANDYKTFLLFYVRVDDPNWDGTYITVQDPTNANADPMALVEFEDCVSAKLGSPNEEVFDGHPLYGKGLEGYTAQFVRNSKWLAELESMNKVHRGYKADNWRNLNHHVFWFHDSTFECIAEGYKVEVFHETLAQILARVYDRMR